MKTLSQHINERLIVNQRFDEKLIINQNYKNIDELETLFYNIDFEHYNEYELRTRNDIFSIMIDYIRDRNIRSFSDFDSYIKASKDRNTCLAVFNKRIKEIDIFQKISNDDYKVFIIYKKMSYSNLYAFKEAARALFQMHVLQNSNKWNNKYNVEYYEISKETFDDISELYNELIKK